MRFLLLILLCPFVALAGVICTPNLDGSWTCSGDGQGDQPGVSTNVLGVCTNCVQMTPDECTAIKTNIQNRITLLLSDSRFGRDNISQALSSVEDLQSEISRLKVVPYNSWSKPADYESVQAWIEEQPSSAYIVNAQGTYNPSYTISTWGGGVNTTANYVREVIAPVIDSVQARLIDADNTILSMQSNADSLSRTVDALDCSTCNGSSDVPGSGGGGGGDSPGGGSGGSSGSCCGPCLEQLQALNGVVSQIKTKVDNIDYNVDRIKSNLEEYLVKINSNLAGISNSVFRIDSYVHDDLDGYLNNIQNATIVISNNVDGLQRDFFQAMKYAAEFKNNDGSRAFDPVEVSTNFMDAAEYKDLPWAARVEALLLNLTKPFDSSSVPDGVTKETMDEVADKVSDLQTAVDPASLSSAYSTQFDKVRRAFSSFDGLFQGDSNGMISFGVIGDHDLTFAIDGNVLSACRTVFSLIWYAGALVALFFIVPFLWSLSLGSFKFLWHLLTLLVK